MINPAMYAAMTASVVQHSQKHLLDALKICDRIASGEGELNERMQLAECLIREIGIVKADMERVLLFLGVS